MQRVGKTYKIVGSFNPLCEFPAQIYPVFSLLSNESENTQKLLQVCSKNDDMIQDFQEITVPKTKKLLPPPEINLFAGINQPVVYGFSLSRSDTIFVKGYYEFRDILRRLLSDRTRSRPARDPLCWVEVCRILDDERLEAVFAGMAVRLLAPRSPVIAKNWISYAPLSNVAKGRALKILRRLRYSDTKEAESSTIRTIALSNHCFIQGELVRYLSDKRIIILTNDIFYCGSLPSDFVSGKCRVERMDRLPSWYAVA